MSAKRLPMFERYNGYVVLDHHFNMHIGDWHEIERRVNNALNIMKASCVHLENGCIGEDPKGRRVHQVARLVVRDIRKALAEMEKPI